MYGGAVAVAVTLPNDVFPFGAQADRGLHSSTHSSVSSEHLPSGNLVVPYPPHSLSFCHSSCFCGGLSDALLVLHTDS